MSVLISIHASELRAFLTRLKSDSNVRICDCRDLPRILRKLRLQGYEERPFSHKEVADALAAYTYFKAHFTKEGLWPE